MNQSAQLDKPPDNAPAVPLSSAGLELVLRYPSLLVAPEVRPALFLCWLAHKTLKGLDDPISIAAPIAVWIAEDGLTPEDAATVLKSMLRPSVFKTHKFGSDLLSDLAAKVEAVIERRRKEAEREAAAEHARANVPTPEDAERTRQLLREFTRSTVL